MELTSKILHQNVINSLIFSKKRYIHHVRIIKKVTPYNDSMNFICHRTIYQGNTLNFPTIYGSLVTTGDTKRQSVRWFFEKRRLKISPKINSIEVCANIWFEANVMTFMFFEFAQVFEPKSLSRIVMSRRWCVLDANGSAYYGSENMARAACNRRRRNSENDKHPNKQTRTGAR